MFDEIKRILAYSKYISNLSNIPANYQTCCQCKKFKLIDKYYAERFGAEPKPLCDDCDREQRSIEF